MSYILTAQNLATVAMALLMAYVLFRSHTPEILRSELVITREKCGRLEAEKREFESTVHNKDLEIADLCARTDLTALNKGQT